MRKQLTLAGLRELIADARNSGHVVGAVVVAPVHQRDLKQELMDLAPPLEGVESDEDVIGFIQGCMVLKHDSVPTGKAWLVPTREALLRQRNTA